MLLKLVCAVLAVIVAVHAIDLKYSEITVVNDTTRFLAQFPNAQLQPFNKVQNIKGNYIFTIGERINGDRLVVTFSDSTQFTKSGDIEVMLTYPARGSGGSTITSMEIYAAVSSDQAGAYIVDGGVRDQFAELLLTCNKTLHYTYELYIYGY